MSSAAVVAPLPPTATPAAGGSGSNESSQSHHLATTTGAVVDSNAATANTATTAPVSLKRPLEEVDGEYGHHGQYHHHHHHQQAHQQQHQVAQASTNVNGESSHSGCGDQHSAKRAATSSNPPPAAPPPKQHQCDEEYFKAYGELDIHRDMLADRIRTFGYRRAILSNYDKFYKKVVLDLGCGTGILSMFCVQAGARKVYAVEASDIAEQARVVIKSNRMEDKITVIQGRIEEVVLPEKVDIIVSEWMGYMLLYEAMLPSIIYARDQWLNRGGYLFPHRGIIYMAPFMDHDTYREKIDFWTTFKDYYAVDMSAVVPFARHKLMERVHINTVLPESLMSSASRLFEINLYTITSDQLKQLEGHFHFRPYGHCTIHGFAMWFTVDFPGNIIISTDPHNEETHWQQTLIYTDPFDVAPDADVTGSMTITPSTVNSRFLNLSLRYEAYGKMVDRDYEMNDYI